MRLKRFKTPLESAIPYFHVVFTIPHELTVLAQQNRKLVYGLLFDCAWATLRELAADAKYLGAETA